MVYIFETLKELIKHWTWQPPNSSVEWEIALTLKEHVKVLFVFGDIRKLTIKFWNRMASKPCEYCEVNYYLCLMYYEMFWQTVI